MINSTLCYIEKDGCYLMLHRVKKKNDINKNKWIGVGGRFLEGEAPDECCKREIKEETGLDAKNLRFRGIVTFSSNHYETEYMHLFTCDTFSGDLIECNEGNLKWIPKKSIFDLSLWEGDKIFLKLLFDDSPFFFLKLNYIGDNLKSYDLNIKVL